MILKGSVNIYKGYEIDIESLPEAGNEFQNSLVESVNYWEENKMELVWLPIPDNKCDFINFAVSLNFKFHHTEDNVLVLVRKMHPKAFVIPYASHYIGVGGVVIDDKNRLLTVRENYKNGASNHYKLPGGTLEKYEHIEKAVVREVFEETGIKTQFQSLICFRHRHKFRFDKSDIYFICKLKPLNTHIIKENVEIAEALWMNIDEYLESESVNIFNKEIVKAVLKGNVLYSKYVPGYLPDQSLFETFMP